MKMMRLDEATAFAQVLGLSTVLNGGRYSVRKGSIVVSLPATGLDPLLIPEAAMLKLAAVLAELEVPPVPQPKSVNYPLLGSASEQWEFP